MEAKWSFQIFKPNGLSKYLKDHQVIRLGLSTSPKLAVK